MLHLPGDFIWQLIGWLGCVLPQIVPIYFWVIFYFQCPPHPQKNPMGYWVFWKGQIGERSELRRKSGGFNRTGKVMNWGASGRNFANNKISLPSFVFLFLFSRTKGISRNLQNTNGTLKWRWVFWCPPDLYFPHLLLVTFPIPVPDSIERVLQNHRVSFLSAFFLSQFYP